MHGYPMVVCPWPDPNNDYVGWVDCDVMSHWQGMPFSVSLKIDGTGDVYR